MESRKIQAVCYGCSIIGDKRREQIGLASHREEFRFYSNCSGQSLNSFNQGHGLIRFMLKFSDCYVKNVLKDRVKGKKCKDQLGSSYSSLVKQ